MHKIAVTQKRWKVEIRVVSTTLTGSSLLLTLLLWTFQFASLHSRLSFASLFALHSECKVVESLTQWKSEQLPPFAVGITMEVHFTSLLILALSSYSFFRIAFQIRLYLKVESWCRTLANCGNSIERIQNSSTILIPSEWKTYMSFQLSGR